MATYGYCVTDTELHAERLCMAYEAGFEAYRNGTRNADDDVFPLCKGLTYLDYCELSKAWADGFDAAFLADDN